ncbi:MAG: type II secretion system F family protein [Limisphaerales bacterium]|jgi:type II secretory pathway component PulF|nr:type II secretion system F family protein [Verrucomicrobiota bacterium]
MAEFVYKARKKNGTAIQGVLEAADRMAALAQLQKQGLLPVSIEPAKKGKGKARSLRGSQSTSGLLNLLPQGMRDYFTRQKRPAMKELANFANQLANLLRAGMPLTAALNSMTYVGSKGIPTDVSRQLKQDVVEGKSLSEAMSRQPVIFSNMFINMVRSGEQSGALVEVLKRLAAHYERFAEVQSKFKSSMVYPTVVVIVGLAVIFFFMTVMMPKFMEIFKSMNAPLPPSTKFLMDSSTFFKHYWWAVLIGIFTVIMLFRRYIQSVRGRLAWDRWKMNAPVIGNAVRMNLFAQFSRTLSTLMQNGVPVLVALKITELVIDNVILQKAIADTREAVTDGKTIAQPLARSGVFPQLMIDMVKIGEETGDIPNSLQSLAETYEDDLQTALRLMTTLIEPILIITMALFVGFILLGILSAMFSLTSNINR